MNPNVIRTEAGIFVLKNDTHLSRWVERDGRLDHAHQYIERFRHLIPVGGTVIDCGTSIGDHTITYANLVGEKGHVLGFEANSDSCECCQLNLAIYPHARIFNVGLSDSIGVSGMEISPNVGASRLTKSGRAVMLAPLDDYTKDLKRCDFIKIDVEGYEPKVLRGAKDTILTHKPAIMIEINHGALKAQGFIEDDVKEVLFNYGYQWVIFDGSPSSEHFDILATPKKARIYSKTG